MSSDVSQTTVIEGLLPRLKAEGYNVFVYPQAPLVPPFLGSYLPDVIALREDRNLAIEVTKQGENSDIRLRDIAALFKGQDDWEFRIIWLTPDEQAKSLSKQPMSEIAEKLAEIDRLVDGGHFDAAFLLSWAVLEAFGRTLFEERISRPQTPGRLVEILATEGVLSPAEADVVRPLIGLRNRLMHGELDAGVSGENARAIQSILHTIVETTVH